MSAKALAIFLQYSDAHQASGMDALGSLVGGLFPGHEASFVIVDNKREQRSEEQLAANVNRISGDNSCREFSGYDRGIRWLESFGPLAPTTPIVIANDSFHRHYGSGYLKLFTRERLARALSSGGILGYIDAFPQEETVFGEPFRKWIRTNLFVLPYGTLRQLGPLFPGFGQGDVFRNDADPEFFAPGAPLSPWYKSFLRRWLFADADAHETFKPEWHSKTALNEETVQSFRDKTCCILCEHLLSAKAQKLGIPLIAVNENMLPEELR
jgi:hypothetical protein